MPLRSIGMMRQRNCRIVLGQRAAQRADQVPAPVDGELDRLDAHLERVARLGPAHGDRPGEDVRTGRGLQLLADLAVVRQHDRGVADIGEAARHGLDRHGVSRTRRSGAAGSWHRDTPSARSPASARACDASAWQSSSAMVNDHLRAGHAEMLVEDLRRPRRARRPCPETRSAPPTGRRPRRPPTARARGSAPPAGWRGRARAAARMISCTCSTRRGDKPLRRLVHQDQLGIGHQRAADRQHLLLAAAERTAGMVDALGELGKLPQHLVEIPAPVPARPSAGRPAARAPARWSAAAGSRARSATGRCAGPAARWRCPPGRWRRAACRAASGPRKAISPERGGVRPATERISVVLPMPLRPRMAAIRPLAGSGSRPAARSCRRNRCGSRRP